MKDDLGERMKSNYEDRTRYSLPRRTYTIIRLDGKAFHTYTKGLKRPFDKDLQEDMDNAIIRMIPEIQGAQFAYTQSDEISILVTDFDEPTTDAWFDGNLQKMCSVSASLITAEFNKLRLARFFTPREIDKEPRVVPRSVYETANFYKKDVLEFKVALFDSRVFTIPDPTEVMNYFIWRNKDCSRNSVSMVAQSLYSHKELQGKPTIDLHEMIFAKGKNWATDFTDGEKNGRIIIKENYNIQNRIDGSDFVRSRWVAKGAWKFTDDKDKLLSMIPQIT